MEKQLDGMRVAILVADGFEQSEMVDPRDALDQAGAETKLISLSEDEVQGMIRHEKGDTFSVDLTLDRAEPDDFDALLLPGGVANPDRLRMDPKAVAFVRHFVEMDKPIAAICHGPWTLIETGKLKGRAMTSWPSLKTDLKNAGVKWVDQEVCVDGNLVTSRKPDDIPAFNKKMVEEFAESRMAGASKAAHGRPHAHRR